MRLPRYTLLIVNSASLCYSGSLIAQNDEESKDAAWQVSAGAGMLHLRGVGDVDRTAVARLKGAYNIGTVTATAAVSTDAADQGHGTAVELTLQRRADVTPRSLSVTESPLDGSMTNTPRASSPSTFSKARDSGWLCTRRETASATPGCSSTLSTR